MKNVAFAAQLPNTDSPNESDWPSQEQAVLGALEPGSVKQALLSSQRPKRWGAGGLRKSSSVGEE